MKTIQAVARYFPENCGGIQTHLSELLPELEALGVESKVVAAQEKPEADSYSYQGVEVYRYPAFPVPKPEPLHGGSGHGGFEYFVQWLKQQKAEIYHQHQWEPKCGLAHLRLAKELGMGTVVSIRLPHPICQRNTLMFEGKTACDGKLDLMRCSQCAGVPKNLPSGMVQALSQVPISVSEKAKGKLGFLALPAYIAERQKGLVEMAKYADRIVAMSQWVYDAIAINGIPEEKLFLLKHGISESLVKTTVAQPRKSDGILRIGFLGRWSPTKGIHVLVEAIKCLPTDAPVELVIHGVPQDEPYRQRLMERIGNDSRIRVATQLKRDDISAALSNYDVLAVPSQWLETGPMVVIEAHANGLPVVGSNLGGVAEKVTHGVDGLLVHPSDPKSWAEAFALLAKDSSLLDKLRQGIKPPRTISMEAADSVTLYQRILAEKSVKTAYQMAGSL